MDLKRYLDYRTYQLSKQKAIHNFNLTILVPVKKTTESLFDCVETLRQNGVEVVFLLTPEIDHKDIVYQVKRQILGNWIVISCEKECLLLSTMQKALLHSSKRYILWVNGTDDLSSLTLEKLEFIHSMVQFYTKHFISIEQQDFKAMAIKKSDAMATIQFVCDCSFFDIKAMALLGRLLELSGLENLKIGENFPSVQSTSDISNDCLKTKYQYFDNTEEKDNTTDCDDIVYDYKRGDYRHELLKNYLKRFDSSFLYDQEFYKKPFRRIVLVQSYNEAQFISSFLDNMGTYFDGIILLDDSSEDGTYDLALHDKILLKVKKKRTEFNDLESRNILLALASFFNANWFCFMDVDERIDSRFADFTLIENDLNIDVLAFNFVHLWNNEAHFNASFPGSYAGVEKIFRMFRNIGFCQINTNKKYHFPATPYFMNQRINSGLLVLHYGFLYETARKKKYDFYTTKDPLGTQKQYQYIISTDMLLKKTEEIRMADLLEADTSKYIDPVR